jgi:hypothetical protein
MVSEHDSMPRAIQKKSVSNKPSKPYSLECVTVHISPGINKKSVLTAWIADIMSSVK